MIEYYGGTVFDAGVDCMVDTVNCIGVMGAGLALEFALRYPEMYEDYRGKCKRKEIAVGKVDYFFGNGYTVVNFPTKWHFKYPSKLEWIDAGLRDFVRTYRGHNIREVAFPKLGTLNGGLDWATVKKLMERFLDLPDLRVVICTDENGTAEGTEKKMLALLNGTPIPELAKQVRLTEPQRAALKSCLPLKRFWQLREQDGIGLKTYGNLFTFFYKKATGSDPEQLSLF